MDIPENQKKAVKPFVVYGFDIVTLGSSKFRHGINLGIPINYFYETKNDIDKDLIMVKTKKIDWNTPQGKLLEEALILTEDEKIFGILKALYEANSYKVLLHSFYPIISILIMYTTTSFLNQSLNLYARPFIVRGVLYAIVSLFAFGLYSFATDFTTVQVEAEADKELAEIGPEVKNAGLRFYEKLLQKNIAIKELTGDTSYTAKGNLNFILRQKSLPLTSRKLFFETEKKDENLNEIN